MALDSYTNLKTALVNWSKRTDALSHADDFIDLCESEMWRTLRIKEMEATATATATSKDLELPTGYIEMRRLRVLSGSEYYDLDYVTPNGLENKNTSGIPKYFTVTSQINFDRATTNTIEMQYYRKLTSLSASNASNDVLANFPDIYLYGSLWALWKWGADEEKSEYYYRLFMTAINGANNQDKSGRYTNPRMKKKGSNP